MDNIVWSYPTIYSLYIAVSSKTSWNAQAAQRLMSSLLNAFPRIKLQLEIDNEAIRWLVVDREKGYNHQLIMNTIRAVHPEAMIEVVNYGVPEREPFYRYLCAYRAYDSINRPIPYVTDYSRFDPWVNIVHIADILLPGERIKLTSDMRGEVQEPKGLLAKGLMFTLEAGLLDARKHDHVAQQIYKDKYNGPNYVCCFSMQIDSPIRSRIDEIFQIMNGQLTKSFERTNPRCYLEHRQLSQSAFKKPITTVEQDLNLDIMCLMGNYPKRFWDDTTSYLLVPEVAALWHLPHSGMASSQIVWSDSQGVDMTERLAESSEKDKDKGIVIGRGNFQGQTLPVILLQGDRDTHTNIIGKTKMGKSTLMHNMIHQDIANGEGVALIDPHGSLVENILKYSIPAHREQDVVLLDLADEQYPIPLNLFGASSSYGNVGRVVGVIEKLFDSGVQVQQYLRAAVAALQNYPNATMKDISRLFSDAAFRNQLIDQVADDGIVGVWDDYDEKSPPVQSNISDIITRRTFMFYGNPYLYPILCHPDTIDFEPLLNQRKIILISLGVNEDFVPQRERDVVGSLVLTLLQIAGMKETRNKKSGRKVADCYLYVDEVQNMVTGPLDKMLAEARGYGLNLIMANQYFYQLGESTTKAVMGNVGTNIIFGCGPDDAQTVGPHMSPNFKTNDLVNLHRHVAAVKMSHRGNNQPAFTLRTDPPLPAQPGSIEERIARIKALSRQQYTPKTRDEVLAWLRERYPRRRRGGNIDYSAPEPSTPPNISMADDIPDAGLSDDEFYE